MLFKLILILLLAAFIIFTIIYYLYSYKRLIIISSPTFMGPLTEISIKKLKETTDMLNEIIEYSSKNLEEELHKNIFTHDKLIHHNDYAYSYTFFIKINNLDYKYGHEKEIFYKGGNKKNEFHNPRVILDKKLNNIKIIIDTYRLIQTDPLDTKHYSEECIIEDIPIQSWVFIGIVLHNKTLDIYVNGKLVKSKTLEKLPKESKSFIKYGDKEGFDGSLNQLIYYFYPLSSLEILNIFQKSKRYLNDTTNTKESAIKLLKLNNLKKKVQTCYT